MSLTSTKPIGQVFGNTRSAFLIAGMLTPMVIAPLLISCKASVNTTSAGTTVVYNQGTLQYVAPHTLEESWDASQEALKQLEFVVTDSAKDALSARLDAKTAKDEDVKVRLERRGEKETSISVKVGILGDESLSLIVLEKIESNF